VAAVAIVAIVRSSGSKNKTIQTVAGQKITERDLELTVEHFHEDADREGKPFPPRARTGTSKSRRSRSAC
jgi:hypothetical protein